MPPVARVLAVAMVGSIGISLPACAAPARAEPTIQCERIEATACDHVAYAAVRAALAASLGPVLHVRAHPGVRTNTIGGVPDPNLMLGIADVKLSSGSNLVYEVFLTPDGRYLAEAARE